MMPISRGKRGVTTANSSGGWVLIESLMSLLLFAVMIGVLNQQNENDFDHIRALKEKALKQDVSEQILILRRLQQDYAWLEGEFETGQESTCSTCTGESLKAWYLSWAEAEGVTDISSTSLLLGVDE